MLGTSAIYEYVACYASLAAKGAFLLVLLDGHFL